MITEKIKTKLTNNLIKLRLIQNKRQNDLINIENVKNATTHIKWLCLKSGCNTTWKATPHNVLNHNTGCPKCGKNQKLTNKFIDLKIKQQNRHLEIKRIGDVIKCNKKLCWLCLTCKKEWSAIVNNVLNHKFVARNVKFLSYRNIPNLH